MRFVRAGLVLAAAVIGLAHSAAAADMPMPGKAVSAPVFSWTGFYAGVHAGWGWNDPTGTSVITEAGISELAAQHNLDANGPLFGGHMGYNWQVNQRWVVGIEGDITGTGIKASSAVSAVCPAPACVPPQPMPGALAAMSQDVNWLASVRGRLGTTWGAGLIYVTGGVAWANVDYKANAGDSFSVCNNGCEFPASSNNTKTGWTVGAGYEAALAGNWTVRAEYLYYSFGGETLTVLGAPQSSCAAVPCTATYTFPDLNIHTVRVGLTYKLGQPAGAPMAAFMPRPAAPAGGWTGLYAGVHAGWGLADPSGTSTIQDSGGTTLLTAQQGLGANGPLFGGHMGYNWQLTPTLVAGIEGDITGTGIKVSSAQSAICAIGPFCATPPVVTPGALISMSQDVNWLASVRGRLGTTWGAGLIYVTGGVAWANVDYKANAGDPGQVCSNNGCALPASSNNTKTGWTVGGGYETALIGNWTVRAEYLYYSFGGETLAAAASPATNCTTAFGIVPPCSATYTFSDLKIHTARLGVSYKF